MGSLTGSGLADTFGRRKALIFSALPMLIGCLLSATAGNLWGMVAGRIAVGVGIGLSSALVPLYISEISPSKVQLNMPDSPGGLTSFACQVCVGERQ